MLDWFIYLCNDLGDIDTKIDQYDDDIASIINTITNITGDISDINTDLAKKANIASPTFTGTPKAPTAASTTNNTQIATTAFVRSLMPTLVTSGNYRILTFTYPKIRIVFANISFTYTANGSSQSVNVSIPSAYHFSTLYSFVASASIDGRTDTNLSYVRGSTSGGQVYVSAGAGTNTPAILSAICVGTYS